jgi:hypothetical protein
MAPFACNTLPAEASVGRVLSCWACAEQAAQLEHTAKHDTQHVRVLQQAAGGCIIRRCRHGGGPCLPGSSCPSVGLSQALAGTCSTEVLHHCNRAPYPVSGAGRCMPPRPGYLPKPLCLAQVRIGRQQQAAPSRCSSSRVGCRVYVQAWLVCCCCAAVVLMCVQHVQPCAVWYLSRRPWRDHVMWLILQHMALIPRGPRVVAALAA